MLAVTDFCFLGFIYMIPKLRVTIRVAMLRARTDPRATASGYSHTRFDSQGLVIPTLAMFPNDDEINAAAKEASEEAESLLALLGISLKRLQEVSVVTLPPLISLRVEEDWFGCGDVISEAQQLRDLVYKADGSDNEDILWLAEATALVTADEFIL